MDDKKLQVFAEELNNYTPETLRDLSWVITKLSKLIERNSIEEWVQYELQPYGEVRDNSEAPSLKVEAELMRKLESEGLFEFQSIILKGGKVIFGGDSGLSGEAAAIVAGDSRSDIEIRFNKGWLTSYDLNLLKEYLTLIKGKLKMDELLPEDDRPKLVIWSNGKVKYFPKSGSSREDTFGVNTSEYAVLIRLAENPHKRFQTDRMIDCLKEPRQHNEDADPQQRVLDKIKAIRKKLGKEVIHNDSNGYTIDCKVTSIKT